MSVVYWGVLFAIIVCCSIAERNPKGYIRQDGVAFLHPDPGMSFIISAVLVLVSGLRYNVGTDYWSYYFWRISSWSVVWKNIISNKEGGFSLLAMLSRIIWSDGQSLILFSAIITVGLYCWTIYRYSQTYLMSLLLYLFLGQWQGSFNVVRQYLAAAILFSGYHFLLKKKYSVYILLVFIASTFHKSALVMVAPCLLFSRKPDITQLIILAVGSIILRFSYEKVFSIIGAFNGKTMLMEDSIYRSTEVNPLRILVGFIPVLIYIVFCEKNLHTEKQDFYINAVFFNAFAMVAGMGSAYLGRIGMFTNGFLILGYNEIFSLIRDDRTKALVIYCVFCVYLVFWVYSIKAGGISSFHWYFTQ